MLGYGGTKLCFGYNYGDGLLPPPVSQTIRCAGHQGPTRSLLVVDDVERRRGLPAVVGAHVRLPASRVHGRKIVRLRPTGASRSGRRVYLDDWDTFYAEAEK
eukprot:5663316-Prymnesium_polylepis.1